MQHLETDTKMQARLSQPEKDYWERYLQMWKDHMNTEVLHFLPEQYRGLDTKKADIDVDMVTRPIKSQHVFFKATALDNGNELVRIGEEPIRVRSRVAAAALLSIVALLLAAKLKLFATGQQQ